MLLEINSLWDVPESAWGESGIFRILSIYSEVDVFVVFNTKKTSSIVRPISVSISHFESLLILKEVKRADEIDTSHLFINQSQLSEACNERRDKRWKLIAPLVEDRQLLLSMTDSSHQPKVVQRGKETLKYTQTIYRCLNRYWRFGQTRDALLPDFYFSGARGEQRKVQEKSLGRRIVSRTGVFEPRTSYVMTESDKANIQKYVKVNYLKSGGPSLAKTYRDFLCIYFPEALLDAKFHNSVPNAPTLRQFRYWVDRLFDKHERIRQTKSEVDYLQNYRENESSIVSDNRVPGGCFEIDATVIDVHIVSKWNRNKVLGRPTLYFIVDRASGMTVGLCVSLFCASWDAARLALFNAFTSKVAYCRTFDIEITEKDWPSAHLPNRLIADNAEMLGLRAEEAVIPMVALEWAGVSRPDFKPFAEGRFNTLNRSELHALSGSVRDNGKIIKSAPDPRSRAIYTLEELTTIIIRDVLDKNSDTRDRLPFQSKLLVETDTPPTPLDFWHIHVSHYMSALKKVSAQEVEARLLRPVTVSVTANGIFWEDMYYSHEKVRRLNLAAIAKTNGHIRLEGRVNDDCFDYIFVKLPNETTFTRCTLLKRSQEMRGLGLADLYYIQDWVDDQHAKRPLPISSIETLSVKNAITRQAKREVKASPKPRTKKARTDNKRQNRIEEMARNVELHRNESVNTAVDSNVGNERKKRQYSTNVLSLPIRGKDE